MKKYVVFALCICFLYGGVLKKEGLPGIDIETSGVNTRFISNPDGKSYDPRTITQHFDNSRAEVLWVDRNHQNAIAQHMAISGNGMYIQAGWYLNNERTSLYRTFANNVPQWSKSMPNANFYIPVTMNYTGEAICVVAREEPVTSYQYTSSVPQWVYGLPGGYEAATSSQGSAVAVNADGSSYAVLARSGSGATVFVFDAYGDTIRTIPIETGSGIYGLDAANDFSVFCISTYDATFVYNSDGTRRDSLYHYGQTVAKISGDGTYLVQGDFTALVRLYRWNGSSYDPMWQHNVGHPWVTSLAISDDGSTIMAGTYQYNPSNSGKVLMYDSSSSTPLWEYTQYGDYVCSCDLTPDGSRGVAGSWGQYGGTFGDVLTVFDKASSTPLLQLLDDIDEPGSIFSVDISDDGSFVTAGGKAVHAREMGNGGEVYAIRMLDSLSNDVGVETIQEPQSYLQVGQTITPQAVVSNFGTVVASFTTVCEICDSLGQSIYSDTAAVTDLQPGSSETVAFSPTWNVPEYGRYTATVYTELSGDEFPANDTLTAVCICFHDGTVTNINYPFLELTLQYTQSPCVDIMNTGSYSETIPVSCEIYDNLNTLVYTGSGQAFLSPQQTATVTLTPSWTPTDTGTYTVFAFTNLNEDYDPHNDTTVSTSSVTTEIMYDDGFLDTYSYVSSSYYDNKFAVRMLPCLSPPYYIPQARFYVSNSDPIAVSIHKDSLGVPGLGTDYYCAPLDTISAAGAGWAVKEYWPNIQMDSSDPFWLVVHWMSSTPSSPYIGMDNTDPQDNTSYWYWTDPGDPGWHLWAPYDFMMRVTTSTETGILTDEPKAYNTFAVSMPSPNPFTHRMHMNFSMAQKGPLRVAVYDITGRLVSSVMDRVLEPGEYKVEWNGIDTKGKKLASGVYFIDVSCEQKSIRKKVILLTE